MSNSASNPPYSEGGVVMAVLRRALPDAVFPGDTFSAGKVRAVLADWDYEEDKGWVCGAGLVWARRQLAKVSEPILVCGFDEEPHVRHRSEGTLLGVKGVIYIQQPVRIEKLRKTVKSLVNVGDILLDADSLRQNIADFKDELRSDFWHGPLKSMSGNLKGIFTDLKGHQYSQAIDKMNIILDRIDKAKTSLQRLKDRFPTDQPPVNVLADMETQVREMDSPAAQVKVCLESNPPKAIPFLNQIDEIIKALEVMVDKISHKDRKGS